MATKKTEELSLEQKIENWKKKYGGVFIIVSDDKQAYLHKPSRPTLKAAFSLAAEDPLGMAEVIIENCWLEGDEEFKTDDDYLVGAMKQLQAMIGGKETELKKL